MPKKTAPVAESLPQDEAPVLPEWFVFEANRTILHPLGYELGVDDDGRFGVWDMNDRAVRYTPAAFARGRAAHNAYMNTLGYEAHMKRKAVLGYVVQES
jgi:hypothetical protein